MSEDMKMSEKYDELIRMGLIQPSNVGDFRMPSARVYVPLTTEYSSYDSLIKRGESDLDAQLVRRSEGNPQDTRNWSEPATTIIRSY